MRMVGSTLLALAVSVLGCAERTREPPASASEERLDPIAPIEPSRGLDPRKIDLGRRLFADVRLSGDRKVACTTCHPFEHALSNGRAVAEIEGRTPGTINVPSLFNVALNTTFNWSGKFDTLEAHNDALIENRAVMASSWSEIVEQLERDQAIVSAFLAAYDDGLNVANARDALIVYQRSLLTPNSRFDRFLLGESEALTDVERAGWAQFNRLGCISCHQGQGVGGNMFQTFGVMRDYFADRGRVTDADLGRWAVTKRERDRYKFRVPGLRNVALTAPYFHDGSADTLEEAVEIMARYQLGRTLDEQQVGELVAFLETLTGELPR